MTDRFRITQDADLDPPKLDFTMGLALMYDLCAKFIEILQFNFIYVKKNTIAAFQPGLPSSCMA
jgi:hypothetical protein